MKNLYLFLVLLLSAQAVSAQFINDSLPPVIDSLYREDQIYIGLTFQLIGDLPEDVSQSGFSGGFHLGFIRDMPVNKRRNIAIGAGLGWSINSYGQELFIGRAENGQTIFRNLNDRDIQYDTNRFSTQLIEMPLEFRWRTSTPESYKFWRIYTGLRLGYVYFLKSNYKEGDIKVVLTDVPEFQRFRLGTTFSFGYNTFNFQVYYSLNPFFKDASLNGEEFGMTTFKLGLMFYIL